VRTAIVIAALVASLIAAAAPAAAKSITASAGHVTATLSFAHGPGPLTTDERLQITAPGMATYDEPVPAKGCFKVCSPVVTEPAVQVADLYGDGEYLVVLNLFTGGADCCGIVQIYAPSAAVGSWVLTERNFGESGAKLVDLGGHERFISGDDAFACAFIDCAQSGLPLQVFSFTGEAFHDVTTSYPALITKDANVWAKAYDANPKQGQGVIAAWAADEDNLGHEATVTSTLARQVKSGNLTAAYVSGLQAFLRKHGYVR
jgi:hypothetical protein